MERRILFKFVLDLIQLSIWWSKVSDSISCHENLNLCKHFIPSKAEVLLACRGLQRVKVRERLYVGEIEERITKTGNMSTEDAP